MTHLSTVFNYISHFRHAGHQVGRKIGDMLEVLTFSAISQDEELLKRLRLEPKLFGFSGAGHKVEFAFNKNPQESIVGKDILDPSTIIGFIECKKVGVEQTINTSFKKKFQKHDNRSLLIPYETEFNIGFHPRGEKPMRYKTSFVNGRVLVLSEGGDVIIDDALPQSGSARIIFALTELNVVTVLSDDNSLRSIKSPLYGCRILDIFGFDDTGVFCVLNDCLSGPQTPEKAKQSSFVALDVRKKRFGSFDKRDNELECVSILVITEFSHWEKKSRNMIESCIDINLVVDDSIIVKAFEIYEEKLGSDFYNYITKDQYLKNPLIKDIADSVVKELDYRIFRDIKDGFLKKIIYKNQKLIVE